MEEVEVTLINLEQFYLKAVVFTQFLIVFHVQVVVVLLVLVVLLLFCKIYNNWINLLTTNRIHLPLNPIICQLISGQKSWAAAGQW